MLAEIPPLPAQFLTSAPPSFTATLNPSPDPPTSNQFSLTDGDGNSVANLILMDATTEITITLAGDASFSSPPLVWPLAPDGSEPSYTVSGSTNNILKFTVPAPTHVLFPWVFRFIVDASGVTGIRSQNIYLAKAANGNPFLLKYGTDNGNFSLVDRLDSSQDGAILGADLVMINTQLNSFSVTLVSDPPITPTPTFASEPLIWSSGSQPGWISSVSFDGPSITFVLDPSSAIGQSTGFQFAIAVNGITILSPDPILINATIGDG